MGVEDVNTTYNHENGEPAKLIEAVTLLLIFLFAFIGNITTIAAILRVRSLRQNLHNAFVVNLCMMDLMVCLFSMSFSFVDIFIVGYLDDNQRICRFNCFMALFALYGNFSGVTLIAVNRCIGIVYSNVIQLKRRHAVIMIACSWVYSFTIAIPTTYDGFPSIATYNFGTHHCSPAWKGSGVYNIICIVLLYGVTAPVMVVSYALIIREIRKREAQVKKYSGCGNEERVKTIEQNIRNGELATKNTELVSFSQYAMDSRKHNEQGNVGNDVMKVSYYDVNVREQDHNNVRDSTLSTRNFEIETADRRVVMASRDIALTSHYKHEKPLSQGKTTNRSSSSTTSKLGADKRVAFAGGLLVLTSTLCWVPYYVVHAIVGSSMHGIGVFSMWLGYANSALDPIIYSLLSQRIRTAVKEMWSKMLRKGRCQKE